MVFGFVFYRKSSIWKAPRKGAATHDMQQAVGNRACLVQETAQGDWNAAFFSGYGRFQRSKDTMTATNNERNSKWTIAVHHQILEQVPRKAASSPSPGVSWMRPHPLMTTYCFAGWPPGVTCNFFFCCYANHICITLYGMVNFLRTVQKLLFSMLLVGC